MERKSFGGGRVYPAFFEYNVNTNYRYLVEFKLDQVDEINQLLSSFKLGKYEWEEYFSKKMIEAICKAGNQKMCIADITECFSADYCEERLQDGKIFTLSGEKVFLKSMEDKLFTLKEETDKIRYLSLNV